VETEPLELLLLGPLEARVGGAPAALGGPKQRALLALLALHANDVVPLDVLVDQLWDDRPPRTAPAYVQNCVHRLRRGLGAESLETRAPGYRLRIDPDAVDARRFERLVREARPLPTRERAAGLRDALALWRGRPLADLAYWDFAQDAIRNLEEQRVNALQLGLEAELELGLHREAIGELDALVREHPTHERLRWLQLLALHRSDRRQDALAAYQEARLAIVDESGMEPGEELRALQRRILQDDPTLMPGGVAPSEPSEHRSQLTRRVVAVCVVELIVDDELDLEAARALVARGLATFEEILLRRRGRVEQLLGEEALAVFGVPAAEEDDPLRALRSAVELRDALGEQRLRAAVEWGEVLVDEHGRTTSGGALTIARRLKEHAREGEILLGPGAAALAGAVRTEPSEGGVRLVELVEGAPAIRRRPDAPLAGRRAELERLTVSVRETVASSSCRRIVVLGEPGIGKTRLVAELGQVVGGEVRVLAGRCVPHAEGSTYLPLAEIVAEVSGGEEIGPALHAQLDGEPDGEQAAARLADALSGAAAVDSGDVFWATRKLLETLALEQPLLVVLEDVHWAEPTFLDLIEYLAGWSTGAPIALVCLARTELLDLRPAWAADTVALRPLEAAETAELLEALPEARALERDDRAAVVAAAEGNPLFLEQLAAHALDGPLEPGRVPASLESLLASRLDSLEAGERVVLERAAVVGREFTRAAVDALAPGDDAHGATSALLALVRRRLVRPNTDFAVDDAFLFDHALIRDATYTAISKSERARLHERLARWLDEHGALDEVVGFHLEQAVENRRATGEDTADLALEAGMRIAAAGERAACGMDHSAGIPLLERASRLLEDDVASRLRVDCVLGFALKSAGEWQAAMRVFEDTAERARSLGDRKHELWALVEQLWPRTIEGTASDDELAAAVDELASLALEDGDSLVRARALDAHGIFVTRSGGIEAGFVAVRKASDAYEVYGLHGFKDPVLLTYAEEGPRPLAEVIDLCDARLSAADAPLWRHGYILLVRANALAYTGEFESAWHLIEDARARLLEFDQAFAERTMWSYAAGNIAMLKRDGTAAAEIVQPALEHARQRGYAVWQVHLAGLSSAAALMSGDVESSLHFAKEARDAVPHSNDRWLSFSWRSAMVNALVAIGDVDQAEREARTEIGKWESTDALIARGRLGLLLAAALTAAGRRNEARGVAEDSARLFDEKGATYLAGLARALSETAVGEAQR
jgi:DNA-binding SARP family transcriptional activator